MEFFLPSVLLLLIAASVVFFVLPRFGPATLAIVSAILLAIGIYKHYTTFGTEYRLSTWQSGLTAYAPYVMITGLLIVIGIYLLYLLPTSTAANSASPLSSVPAASSFSNMPSAASATNSITAGVNKVLNTAANAASSLTGKNNSSGNSLIASLTGGSKKR